MGRPLVFAVNGERVELSVVDPRTTVLQYIRSQPSLQGTKLGCGEGGCGACTVLLSKYDPNSNLVEELTINSCLAPLCSIDGCAVTTTEGLKASRKEYHAVHKRLAGFHGSQCGFCTPGMSMSIYGGLRKALAKSSGAPTEGGQQCNGTHSADTGSRAPVGALMNALDAEKCVSGNICRCTGYRPILDVCKSFSGEVDVEDLGLNTFWASSQHADGSLLPSYDPVQDPKFPTFLIDELESRKDTPANDLSFRHVEGREATVERVWITASSLSDACNLLEKYSRGNLEVKLVVGNTSAGIYKDMNPQMYIDINHIPELQVVKSTKESLEVGAGISLSKLITLLETESHHPRNVVYDALAKHVSLIASEQVRNRASLGGNLMLAQQLGFDSDLATILLGAGAEVTMVSSNGQSTVAVEEFLSQRGPQPGRILVSIRIPRWTDLGNAGLVDTKLFFKTYRISCRPRGNSVAYINAAFLAVVEQNAPEIRNVRLAFGAFGGPHAIRAENTEKLLLHKSVSPAVLLEAINVLKDEINPPSNVHKSAYRRSVAVGFFFDFFNTFLPSSDSKLTSLTASAEVKQEDDRVTEIGHKRTENGYPSHPSTADDLASNMPALSNGSAPPAADFDSRCTVAAEVNQEDETVTEIGHKATENASHSGPLKSDALQSTMPALSNGSAPPAADFDRQVIEFGRRMKPKGIKSKRPTLLLSASQKFATSKEFWPVAHPSEKTGVHLQVSGEAVYVDDITPVMGTLYAAFVLSDKRPGKIVGIDATEALKNAGVVDFVTAKDIPGQNIGFSLLYCDDRLFAEDRVECRNDTIGLLVADSYEHAREAAAKVKINVEEEEDSVYTIEAAIAKESFAGFGVWSFASSTSVGEEPARSDHRIEKAEVSSGSQYYFYMETQTAYAVPDEDGCMTVYSSNQAPNAVQKVIASCLGIPMNSVRVITRRLGGAFGGKMSRASLVAVACALAAHKLKRPVRISLDRQTDMRMCGGRHDVKAVYSVDFNDDGKVNGLQANIFADGGRGKDISSLIFIGVNIGLKQYNWGSMRTENKICKTNKVNRGIMRGPGDLQGHFIAETVIEHVAAYLGIDPCKVRERNIHSMESLGKFFPTTTNSVDSYTLPHLWEKLKDQSQFEKRQLAVKIFNEGSKWVKKGIDIVGGLYDTGTISKQARVSIFEDGSIVVEVGGTEMGQGLWTKVKQAVAYGLSKLWGPEAHPLERVDLSRIRVVQNESLSLPNSEPTGGSTGSEASSQAALMACRTLVDSLTPFLQKLRESGATPSPWEAIVGMAKFGGESLTAHGNYAPDATRGYLNFGVCVSEVSIDLLTGSTTILQTDLLYDCGRSLNPAIDIGQVEGAFVMGVGFYLMEELREENGELISNGTWNYKPPTADNIPRRFNVELSNTKGIKERILSSKASGEPPILLAKSVHSAVRKAITAAREDLDRLPPHEAKENGTHNGVKSTYFRLDSPASIDKVKALCGLQNVERYLSSLTRG